MRASSARALLRATTSLAMLTAMAAPTMAQEAFVLDEIFVEAASRDARSLGDVPASVSVVGSEDIARQQPTTFEELIGSVPGVSIDGGARGMAQEPNIRGFSDNQILLRVDGGRQNFNLGHQGRFFIDPELVKQVEVVRGGGSTLYGSGALGGVMAVETIDAADFVSDGQGFGGRQTLSFNSNGNGFYTGTTLASDMGAADVLGYIGYRHSDDISSADDTEIEFSTVNTVNAMLKFGFEPSAEQRFEISVAQYEDDSVVPAATDSVASARSTIVDRASTTRDIRVSYEFNPEDNPLIDMSALLYSTDIMIEADALDGSSESVTNYETLGVELVNRSDVSFGVPTTLVYGVEIYRDTQNGERTAPSSFAGAQATTIGAFVDGTFEVSDALTVSAGLRFDSYRRDPDDASQDGIDEDFLSPRIGVSYQATETVQVFGNLSRSFRAPTISELYSDGRHFPGGFPIEFHPIFGFPTAFAPDNFFVPNPDLEPEIAEQVEIGMRYSSSDVASTGDSLSFGVAAYYAQVENFIELEVDIAAGTSQSVNTDAKLWGVEAEIAYDAGPWYVSAGLQVPSGRDDEGDGLGSISQDKLNVTFGMRPSDSFEWGVDVLFAGEKEDTAPSSSGVVTVAEAYTVVDLFATYTPTSGALAGSTVRLGVDNAFDEEYVSYPSLFPMPGRSFKASVSYEF